MGLRSRCTQTAISPLISRGSSRSRAARSCWFWVFIDEHGTPTDFSTTDRFLDDVEHPGTLVRGHWRTPIVEWTEIGGRPLPAKAKATWRLPQGDFNYVEFQLMPDSVAFNVPPGA